MSKKVLTEEGKETLDKMSYRMYHGPDSDYTPNSTEPEKVEDELIKHIESKGLEYAIPPDGGKGTARHPFLIHEDLLESDGKYVVKFARYKRGGESGPEKGRIQNHCEVEVWNRLEEEQRQFFVPIREHDENYFWLVMDFAQCFDQQGEYVVDAEEISNIVDKMNDAGIMPKDYVGSFGEHEGEPKYLDYGLDVEWYDYGFGEKIVSDDEWGEYDTNKPAGLI